MEGGPESARDFKSRSGPRPTGVQSKDGWAKDADAHTAFGQSVEPLPFHAMSQYPYKDGVSRTMSRTGNSGMNITRGRR
jgi:hypothetical protein